MHSFLHSILYDHLHAPLCAPVRKGVPDSGAQRSIKEQWKVDRHQKKPQRSKDVFNQRLGAGDFHHTIEQLTVLKEQLQRQHEHAINALRQEINRHQQNQGCQYDSEVPSTHAVSSKEEQLDIPKVQHPKDTCSSDLTSGNMKTSLHGEKNDHLEKRLSPDHSSLDDRHSNVSKPPGHKLTDLWCADRRQSGIHLKVEQTAKFMIVKYTCLLHPMGSFISAWDQAIVFVLVFTAVVTPVEIVFFADACGVSFMFIFNQLVNSVYITDFVMQFFIMYETKSSEGLRLVRDRHLIALHYLKSWCLIDLLSVLPFDILGCYFNSDNLRKLKIARFVRLVRLVKLVRLFRASRIFQRWQVKIAFPYTSQTLIKFITILVMGAHWMGCLWGLVGLEAEGYTWVDALRDAKPHGMDLQRPMATYVAALHYAFMTITSIGYGDISPQQAIEYITSALCQMSGGLLWAYGISELISVVSNLNPNGTQFRRTMDDLNHMMRIKGLDENMQVRCRSFFLQARELHDAERYQDLLRRMSPQLLRDVALVTNVRWISRVWYLTPDCVHEDSRTGVSDTFLAQIAVSMHALVCCQREVVQLEPTLRVLTRGLISIGGKLRRAGDVWGEDFILENPKLRLQCTAICLTFIEYQCIHNVIFHDILEQHGTPRDKLLIRRAVLKLAVIRGLPVLSRKILAEMQAGTEATRHVSNHAETPVAPDVIPSCKVDQHLAPRVVRTRESDATGWVSAPFVRLPGTMDDGDATCLA